MKTAEQWLAEYGQTHRHPLNKKFHMICVPSILLSVLGTLYYLRFSSQTDLWWLNGNLVFSLFALGFYARLGRGPFFLMISTIAAMDLVIFGVEMYSPVNPLIIYSGVFVVACIGQFIGHHYEGKAPSFFQDLQFLMIGPLWCIATKIPIKIVRSLS